MTRKNIKNKNSKKNNKKYKGSGPDDVNVSYVTNLIERSREQADLIILYNNQLKELYRKFKDELFISNIICDKLYNEAVKNTAYKQYLAQVYNSCQSINDIQKKLLDQHKNQISFSENTINLGFSKIR